MRIRFALLTIAVMLIPALSNSAERTEVSWWVGEGASFSINGSATNYSEWWGVVQAEGQACAINFSSMFGQKSAILFQGVSSGGVMKLSFVKAIRGSYSPGYGPIDPRIFYKGTKSLVQALTFHGETRPRFEVLTPVGAEVFKEHESELQQKCSSRLTPKVD